MDVKSKPSSHYTLKYRDQIAKREEQSLPFYLKKTDAERWRLVAEGESGRVVWRYMVHDEDHDKFPQDAKDRFFLALPSPETGCSEASRPSEAIANAAHFHGQTQIPKVGCWTADLSCILFVTPFLIMAWYITGACIPESHAVELFRYFMAVQDPIDGGWPTHLQGESTLMGTVLIYVALRLMGVPAKHEALLKARMYLLGYGGAIYLPCWAKFWLCLLNLYDWDGADPYPVEIWLLPKWVPINPWRFLCITRQVFLPMSYLSARRFQMPSNPLLDEIREEIFTASYSSNDFASFQGVAVASPRHQNKSWIMHLVNWIITNIWHPYLRPLSMAQRGEKVALELIRLNDKWTDSTGLISVDEFLTMICYRVAEGPDSQNMKRIQKASFEYVWVNERGMQVQSIHGGHTWETALALQSYVAAGFATHPDHQDVVRNAYEFLIRQQFCEDWPDSQLTDHFSRLGGWPFTTRYHGQPCSDCTGEAFKAILMFEETQAFPSSLSTENGRLAVDNLLKIQNSSGGYSAFEPIRGGQFLEYLNGTEIFGRVMCEYDYTECTSSSLMALIGFRKRDSFYRVAEINKAIKRGIQFIHKNQHADGSWKGNWGIGFTYAAMFGLEVLGVTGETYGNSSTVKRACDFLVSKRKPDGGWGETIRSILDGAYAHAEASHTVQTAWACLGLMYADYPDPEPIHQGVRLIMSRQMPSGEWPQEAPCGNGILTCLLHYHNYIYTFPMRALQCYKERYGDLCIE